MKAEVEVVEEPKGVFTISVGKMDMLVVEGCGVSVVAPRNVIFGPDLLWLMKAACDISTLLFTRVYCNLEEVKIHLDIREKLWKME